MAEAISTPNFLRGWHIGQYNFDDYGEDHGDPRWTKRVHLKLGEPVHQDSVSPEYYIDRLGPSDEQEKKIRDHFKWENERDKATQEDEKALEEKK